MREEKVRKQVGGRVEGRVGRVSYRLSRGDSEEESMAGGTGCFGDGMVVAFGRVL